MQILTRKWLAFRLASNAQFVMPVSAATPA